MKEEKGKAKLIIINSIRVLLVLAIITSFYTSRNLVLIMSLSGLALTFFPFVLERVFKKKFPALYEIMIILFVYGVLFLGEVRGLYGEFWWWDVFLNMISAIALGFVGLTILHTLYKEEKINASPLVVSVFSFCFAVAIGALWEVFEFLMDYSLGFNMQKTGLTDTMKDTIVNVIGAGIISCAGYYQIRKGKKGFVSTFFSQMVVKNPKIFGSDDKTSVDGLIDTIKKGEHKGLEFKSSLRTNIHTNQADKNIEHATLKTISAYLNSHKGTLLVGVSDKGEIIGLDTDKFVSKDKLLLHLTNLIKDRIGSEFMPYIKYEIIDVNGKDILKIDCSKSHKHVFLKNEKDEEFYVRNGPSSTKLSGSSLVEYINNSFRSS